MKLYKTLQADGQCHYGGLGSWYLPRGEQPGGWMPEIHGNLIPCQNGYHLSARDQLVNWLGPAIFEAEINGSVLVLEDKIVAREARLLRQLVAWNERSARLFAYDCAMRAIDHTAKEMPPDIYGLCIFSLKTAAQFADGKVDLYTLTVTRDDLQYILYDGLRMTEAATNAIRSVISTLRSYVSKEAAMYARTAITSYGYWVSTGAECIWQSNRLMSYLYPNDSK